jgi:protein-L-isoaspartate(D-aspartate) O-methyltransferase
MIMRLRSRGISDAKIMGALERAPRSRFVSNAHRERAFDEVELPIPCGQVMLTPLLSAQFLQVAELSPESKVLIIGGGSGYVAGLAAQISRRVYVIERYQDVLQFCEANLARCEIGNVTSRWGDGRYGWKANAPFDRIIVTAGLAEAPKGLLGQLAPDGRLVGVINSQLGWHDGKAFHRVLGAEIPMLEPGKSQFI